MPFRPRLLIALCIVSILSAALWGAYDPIVGSWKLNIKDNNTNETRYSPGFPVPQSQLCTYEFAAPNGVRYTEDTVGPDGKKTHIEYTAQLDGKDYPVQGDPYHDSVALKRVKAHITEGTYKRSGEVTGTFTVILWGNGLLMTVESKETRDGKTYTNREVYNKLLPTP